MSFDRVALCSAFISVAAMLAGCSHHERRASAPVAPPVDETTLTSAQQPRPAVNPSASSNVSAGVSASNEIIAACNLVVAGEPTNAPVFPFDQSELLDQDYKVLNQIGQCLTTGPLAGREVLLTGRADSRGTNEYNMTLGAQRAHTVSTFLSSIGVNQSRMHETSRGELDAVGTDVLAQQQDRRVDITLKK